MFNIFQIDRGETAWIQLDIRTKLCIRDSLYRLARSAEQRHNCANLISGNGDDRDASRALMVQETNKYAITVSSQTSLFQWLLRRIINVDCFHYSFLVMWLEIVHVIGCFITFNKILFYLSEQKIITGAMNAMHVTGH